jgi:hypothetical protein
MFYTLAGAARRTGLGEFTILRAIEEGRIAAIKDLFGDWQVHELELDALASTVVESAGREPVGNGGARAAKNPDGETLEFFGSVGHDSTNETVHPRRGWLTETTQAVHGSSELVPAEIFLPELAAKQRRCLSDHLPHRYHKVGRRAAKPHRSAPSASAWDDGLRLNDEDKISGRLPHSGAFRKLPVRGILLVALGWISGLSTYHLVSSAFPISKQIIASQKQATAANIREPSGPEKSGKSAAAPKSNAAAHPSRRRMISKPVLEQERETTGSIKQQDRLQQDRVTQPFPDTRPTTVSGWTIRSVTDGIAVLDGPYGTWKAARGDLVPGLGKVDSIVLWGNRWIVATTRGLITTP